MDTHREHPLVVVKIGGGAGIDLDLVSEDIVSMTQRGDTPLVVHGGSALTNQLADQMGHPPQFLTSPSGFTSRRTDRHTLEIFQMACASINKGLVERLQARGINAIGLAGMDGRIWVGSRKAAIRAKQHGRTVVIRDDYTGRVEQVNTPLLEALVREGYVPVLTPPAISYEGEAINVDADRAAARTAAALGAEALVILSNVPGLLRRYPDESSLIRVIRRTDLNTTGESARDRMKKKVLAAEEALAGGVSRVVLADGRVPQPIRRALEGEGTVIHA